MGGTALLSSKHHPHEESYKKMRTRQNIHRIHKDKHELNSSFLEAPVSVHAHNKGEFNTMPSTNYIANGSHFVKVDKRASVEMLKNPVPLGTALLSSKHHPHEESYEKMRTRQNIHRIHKDKHESNSSFLEAPIAVHAHNKGEFNTMPSTNYIANGS